jgi:copper chaperone CopZ
VKRFTEYEEIQLSPVSVKVEKETGDVTVDSEDLDAAIKQASESKPRRVIKKKDKEEKNE